jgi:hypothetical protein
VLTEVGRIMELDRIKDLIKRARDLIRELKEIE